MHEMSLVREVVDVVVSVAAKNGATAVKSVSLAIGEMRDVVEHYVPELFEFLARDTVARGAKVTLRRIPMNVRCNVCGEVFHLDSHDPKTWTCKKCGTKQDYKLISGDEFIIESIELTTARCEDELPLAG